MQALKPWPPIRGSWTGWNADQYFTWDVDETLTRLHTIEDDNGRWWRVDSAYDADMKRVRRTHAEPGGLPPYEDTTTQHFTYDGDKLVFERSDHTDPMLYTHQGQRAFSSSQGSQCQTRA
jgi:hypothetical protein